MLNARSAATVQARRECRGHRVETKMMPRERETRHFDFREEVIQELKDLRRRVDMLVAHDGAVVEAPPQTVRDARRRTPGEPPEEAPLGGKTSAHATALAKEKGRARDDGRQIGEVFQHRDG